MLSMWLTAILYFFYTDAMSRLQYRSEIAVRGVAEAKGRYIAATSHDFGTPITMLHMLLASIERNAEAVTQIGARVLTGMHVALDDEYLPEHDGVTDCPT